MERKYINWGRRDLRREEVVQQKPQKPKKKVQDVEVETPKENLKISTTPPSYRGGRSQIFSQLVDSRAWKGQVPDVLPRGRGDVPSVSLGTPKKIIYKYEPIFFITRLFHSLSLMEPKLITKMGTCHFHIV